MITIEATTEQAKVIVALFNLTEEQAELFEDNGRIALTLNQMHTLLNALISSER